ncbi:rhomboid family intramembrane serine protease [soil metagenome]
MSIGSSIWDDFKRTVNSGNTISILLIINVCMFILINLLKVIDKLFIEGPDGVFYAPVMEQILLRAEIMGLLTHPWTLITHMFAHEGVFHLVFNMLFLYWFGRIIQEFIGNRHLLPLYILGGLSGAFLMILSYNIFPGLATEVAYVRALGASAGVMAIVVGAATLVPDYTVFLILIGPVRLKYIALVLVLLDFIGMAGFNGAGAIAHLGGALMGFIYIRQLKVGHDWAVPFDRSLSFIGGLFSGKRKGPRVVYKRETATTGTRSPEQGQRDQARIDSILDKINQSGYDSLTKEEKEFLFRYSNKD